MRCHRLLRDLRATRRSRQRVWHRPARGSGGLLSRHGGAAVARRRCLCGGRRRVRSRHDGCFPPVDPHGIRRDAHRHDLVDLALARGARHRGDRRHHDASAPGADGRLRAWVSRHRCNRAAPVARRQPVAARPVLGPQQWSAHRAAAGVRHQARPSGGTSRPAVHDRSRARQPGPRVCRGRHRHGHARGGQDGSGGRPVRHRHDHDDRSAGLRVVRRPWLARAQGDRALLPASRDERSVPDGRGDVDALRGDRLNRSRVRGCRLGSHERRRRPLPVY